MKSAVPDISAIQKWIDENKNIETIVEELSASGYDEETISIHLREFRKVKNGNRQFIGFFCLGLGALLGFISCVLSIINPVPELYNIILYGLTSLAIAIIIVGLYMVFQ
jgi:hypothetical protein